METVASNEHIWITIVIILIALLVGYAIYNIMRANDFTKNAKIIMRQFFIEMRGINDKLENKDILEEEKNKLLLRKKEIINSLSQFYGYDLRNESI